VVSYLELAAERIAPRWARSQARAVLRAWHIVPESIETAELLVSELVTNAVLNVAGSYPELPICAELIDAECVSLTMRHAAGCVVIEVFDRNPNPPVLVDADVNAERGRGLMLVQALSKEWNYLILPSGGKIVYCVIEA